jgi:UDP-glucose 4-epimerase
MIVDGKKVLVTGGTGSLGRTLVRRLLDGSIGDPAQVTVFSRSEAMQHAMRIEFQRAAAATEDIAYGERLSSRLVFRIGDIAHYPAVAAAVGDADIVFHAAAMKQVPACEYHPAEAARINVGGAANVVRAIREQRLEVEAVVTVSTDKACKPVNVMGMTKAIQERVFAEANLTCPGTRFMVARYGNVIASRGSVIPLFAEQIRAGGPVTITSPRMTRFLMSLDRAVDTVAAALEHGHPGETFIPRIPSARVIDLAELMAAGHDVEIQTIGERPGEKADEVLVSAEESPRTTSREGFYVIGPILPELRAPAVDGEHFEGVEYSSADAVIGRPALAELLGEHGVIDPDPTAVPVTEA